MKTIHISIFLFFIVNHIIGQQCENDSTGLIPINDLGTNTFNGMQGGLYGNGQNNIPTDHLNFGIQLANEVRPLNAQGFFDNQGKIGFISMGMSNANLFFGGLRDSAIAFPDLNSKLVMVNGATGGMDIDVMLNTSGQYWVTLDQKLNTAGITKAQVQVIWFMQAKHISGIPPNEGIEHIEIMESKFLQAFQYFKIIFPNLKQIYCSGRDYGGYSQAGGGNPEPYSYYTNWAFRKLIERQMNGDTLLAFSGMNPKTAWLSWANYVWSDGKNLRSDGFNWRCPEDVQQDGVHPNFAGKAKVASLLFNFFKNDTTSYWFKENTITNNKEIANDFKTLKIYPNPTFDLINIVLNDYNYSKIELINRNGMLLEETNKSIINISAYPSGMYLIRIYYTDKILTERFFKL